MTAIATPIPALTIGNLSLDIPVVLAPMAGVTNRPFRQLCRRFGAPLLVSEMVNARGLVEHSDRTSELTAFGADETTRSLQLYGTDPAIIGEAVARLIGEHGVGHVDLNFGCPVRKVTRHGGGAAVPAWPRLLGAIVEHAVAAANGIPVTVKMRVGLDADRITFLEAGRVAEAAGAAAVALHARTATQMYSGTADWARIGELVRALTIPVLGNGDIWTAADARRMMDATGCAGVVIGRGCLGRPWFFGDLAAEFGGAAPTPIPRSTDITLGFVLSVLWEHALLLADHIGDDRAVLDIRKHIAWYLTGFPVGSIARQRLMQRPSLGALRDALDEMDQGLRWPEVAHEQPRGTWRGPYPVVVPAGWCDRESAAPPTNLDAELAVSGG